VSGMDTCPVCDTPIGNPQATKCPECGEPLFTLEAPDPTTGKARRVAGCQFVLEGQRCPLPATVGDGRALTWCSLHSMDWKRKAESREGMQALALAPQFELSKRMGREESPADMVTQRAADMARRDGESQEEFRERLVQEAGRLGYTKGRLAAPAGSASGPRRITPSNMARRGEFMAATVGGVRRRLVDRGLDAEAAEAVCDDVRAELRERLGLTEARHGSG